VLGVTTRVRFLIRQEVQARHTKGAGSVQHSYNNGRSTSLVMCACAVISAILPHPTLCLAWAEAHPTPHDGRLAQCNLLHLGPSLNLTREGKTRPSLRSSLSLSLSLSCLACLTGSSKSTSDSYWSQHKTITGRHSNTHIMPLKHHAFKDACENFSLVSCSLVCAWCPHAYLFLSCSSVVYGSIPLVMSLPV
jgi:hypothetical protein